MSFPNGLGDSLTFKDLQEQSEAWRDEFFPGRDAREQLLGALEELGELAHAQIKAERGIRGSQSEHQEAKKDAIGDICVYLAGYCSASGISMQDAVEYVWAQVRNRDWKANPLDGSVA